MDPEANDYPFLTRNMLDFEGQTSFGLQVILRAISTQSIFVSGFTKSGPFTFTITPAGTGAAETFNFSLPDVPIAIACHRGATGNDVPANRCYAVIFLTLNGTRSYQLARGYVHVFGNLAWPAATGEGAMGGRGFPSIGSSSNPAAGAEVDFALSGLNCAILHSATVTLVTDGTAANRRVHLVVNQGEANERNFFGEVDQTATTTRTYTFAPVGVAPDTADDNDIIIPIPPDLLVTPGGTIATETTNLQVGDNFGVMGMTLELFMAPA
jgi:hypothetical protein